VDWAVGGAVLLVYAVVQLVLLLGPQPFDPAKYFETAVDFPDVPADRFTLRIGLIAPVRVAVFIFGPSEASLYAEPIGAGLLLAGAVYATMLVLFRNRLVAAASALVMALNPSYLARSSSIFPDPAATATFTLGFLCLVLGARRGEEEDGGRMASLYTLCAGILFGWTYLIRESSLVLLPAVATVLLLLRYPLRRVALLSGAVCVFGSFELLYGLVLYRDPLVHARLLLEREGPALGGRAEAVELFHGWWGQTLDAILVFPRILLTWRSGWILVALALVFLVALVLRSRDRRLWLLAAWCLGFWIPMTALGLGSLVSGSWILNVTNARYWFPAFPPLVMGALGGLTLLLPRRSLVLGSLALAPMVTAVVAAFALGSGIAEFRSCAQTDAFPNDPLRRWHELRAWLAGTDADRYDVIWTDRQTRLLLPAFTRSRFGGRIWDGRLEAFHEPAFLPPAAGARALILVHKDRLDDDVSGGQARLNALRGAWAPVFVSDDARMVLLAQTGGTLDDPAAWWRLSGVESADASGCGRRPIA
jgi:hypothetical protein